MCSLQMPTADADADAAADAADAAAALPTHSCMSAVTASSNASFQHKPAAKSTVPESSCPHQGSQQANC